MQGKHQVNVKMTINMHFTAINVCKEERPTTDIKLCSTKINILVDTGASVNLIESTTYNSELNGVQMFSKLNLNNGYHQLMLHQDSRFITTFTAHMGL